MHIARDMSLDVADFRAVAPQKTKSRAVPPIFRTHPFHVMFDRCDELVTEPIARFHGWFAALKPMTLRFRVNGKEIDHIQYFPRPDVTAVLGDHHTIGWSFFLDVLQVMTPGQHALVIEVLADNRVVACRCCRCRLGRDLADAPDLAVFIHVPKAGGTSARVALEMKSDIVRLLPVYNDPYFLPLDQLSCLSEASLAHTDVVFGHFPCGTLHGSGRTVRYLSIIRNPIEIATSFYHFARLHQKSARMLACDDIIDAMSSKVHPNFDNIITRMFAGVPDGCAVDETAFDRAVARIEHDFAFIGLLERLDVSLERIGRYLGVNLSYVDTNKTEYSRESRMFDKYRFLDFAADHLRYDIALYEHVVRKFWSDC